MNLLHPLSWVRRIVGRTSSRDERGQALVLFVLSSTVLLGAAAIATDASWLYVSQQRMQRAADAAALAGAVYLPGDPGRAYSAARAESTKNGYPHGQRNVVVTPTTDPSNPRRLIVDIDEPVGTYFARVLCVTADTCLEQVDIHVQGRAEYALPVPMGSPQNYYGIGYLIGATSTSSERTTDETDWRSPESEVSGGAWNNPWRARRTDSSYADARSRGDSQVWRDFDLQSQIRTGNVQIEGIEVRLNNAYVLGYGAMTNCRVYVELSWNGGSTWTDYIGAGPLSTDSRGDYTVGSPTDVSVWGSHAWSRDDTSNGHFRARLTWWDNTGGCAAGRYVRVDDLEVRVSYSYDGGSSTTVGQVEITSPTGGSLTPQNFWAVQQSQGASNLDGDAYMARYDTRGGALNDAYDPDAYYNYAIEIPAGASSGEVWLFDPGFCDGGWSKGTGEAWTGNGPTGYTPRQPVSAFFDLYDTKETLFDGSDDQLVASSGEDFRRLNLSDHQLGRTFATDCSSIEWHHGWWRLASGLQGGNTYRLHAYSTDPTALMDQDNTTAVNSFSIYANAVGGDPRVFGLGTMEAYVRLPGGTSSEFYLSRIAAQHAGKTIEIKLWDPGDTKNLAATLQILKPTSTGYVPATFSHRAARGNGGATSCSNRTGSNVTSVTTNTGGNSLYNGCWLTITIPLATDYTAPHPSSDPVTDEGGWWKIRYNMSGSSSDYSYDLTTWQVSVRGSPVHLVVG